MRTTPELGFLGPARVFPDLIGLNDSSALFRRELFERFGGWDTARIAADKELIWRFERLAGRPREAFRRRHGAARLPALLRPADRPPRSPAAAPPMC